MSNCCKTIRSKYPCCAVEMKCTLGIFASYIVYSNWTLGTTPIQLVSVWYYIVSTLVLILVHSTFVFGSVAG